MKLSKEKEESLLKYVSQLANKLGEPASAKHIRRNSYSSYKLFLEREIATVKKRLAANKEV